jgi:hypothetical protein
MSGRPATKSGEFCSDRNSGHRRLQHALDFPNRNKTQIVQAHSPNAITQKCHSALSPATTIAMSDAARGSTNHVRHANVAHRFIIEKKSIK